MSKRSYVHDAKFQRRMYTARERMQYEACACDAAGVTPAVSTLDKIADAKLYAGFDRRRLCETHHIALSVTNRCALCE